MLLSDALKTSIEFACAKKERAAGTEYPDIHASIEVFRGDEPVAVITLQNHQRDEILATCTAAAVGYDADALSLIFETFVRPSMAEGGHLHPVTGRPLTEYDTQDLVDNHDAIAKGWVTEALLVVVVNRAGDDALAMIPYHYWTGGQGERNIVFDAPQIQNSLETGSPNQGQMADVLRRAMIELPSMSALVPEHLLKLGRDERDLVITSQIGRLVKCRIMLFAADQTDRAALFRQHGHVVGEP